MEKELNEQERLYEFMKKYITKKKLYTHQMLYEPYGKYNIPDHMQKKFMKLYENAVISGYKLSVAEKHKEYGPILIEINFVFKENKRYYTEETIISILK